MSNYIPNMNFLSYIVVEISLTKNVERKKTNKHSKEVLNPKVKTVFVNLTTFANITVVEISFTNYGRAGGRTDG